MRKRRNLKLKEKKAYFVGQFELIKFHDNGYHVVECSQKSFKHTLSRLTKGKEYTSLLKIDSVPPNVSLFTVLKGSGLIKAAKKSFTTKLSEEELVNKINQLSWERIITDIEVKQLNEDLDISDSDSDVSDVSDDDESM